MARTPRSEQGAAAGAALAACRKFRVSPKRIGLIGSHGQTIFHQGKPAPYFGRATASTLQIGEPSVIAARTGIPTVGDFRPADVALRDRRMLSADGIFIVVATISEGDGSTVAETEVIFRGVPFVEQAETLKDKIREEVGTLQNASRNTRQPSRAGSVGV